MPRTARIDYPGARHHVMNRGARGQQVFLNESYCSQFLLLLGRAVERYGIRIHGFAIMPNHFHLMVESVSGNLGDAMKYVTSQFCYFLNRGEGWDGQVFRGRYKNKPIYLDQHWIYLLAYLHLNPVRSRLVSDPQEAIWTSHRAYLGKRVDFDWLTIDDLSEYFDAVGGYRSFVSDVKKKSCPAPDGFGSVTFDSVQMSRYMVTQQQPLGPRIAVEKALAEVLVVSGSNREELFETRRGRAGNPVRALAAWWLTHGAGMSNIDAGRTLKMSSNAVCKVLKTLRDNPQAYGGRIMIQWIQTLKGQ